MDVLNPSKYPLTLNMGLIDQFFALLFSTLCQDVFRWLILWRPATLCKTNCEGLKGNWRRRFFLCIEIKIFSNNLPFCCLFAIIKIPIEWLFLCGNLINYSTTNQIYSKGQYLNEYVKLIIIRYFSNSGIVHPWSVE